MNAMPRSLVTRLAVLGGIALAPSIALGQMQHDGHTATGTPPVPAALGEVHFPVACTPEAQAAFDAAMTLQHSFWHQAADEAFAGVLQRDPSCTMALWGRALTRLLNPFTPPAAANLRQGRAYLEEARRIGVKNDRERGLIDALSVLFTSDDVTGHRARLGQFTQGMEQLHQRFPDDSEIAIFTALSLIMSAPPTDKTYANQLRAGDMLAREFETKPRHPGVSHYMIHTYDTPALAARGVPAADRYAGIAPDAPHALHMPSHIFTRVGRWEDSIATNIRSAEIARARNEVFDEVHAMDYLVYAYLQTGQTAAARQVLDGLGRFDDWRPPVPIAYYALAAMPARWVLERGAWDEAAALDTRRFDAPFVDAITAFTRATGAARTGRPDAAASDTAALGGNAAALAGRDPYWHEQVEILRIAADGWVAFARGERDKGLALLNEAAEREGRTEKHPVTPGPLMPAREQYAEMLMLADRPVDAQREYEAVLQTEPRRFRAVHGAGLAAEAAGDRDAARRHYAALLEIAERADSPQPAIEHARVFVAQQ
jgi:tetratricopeptide (TPR) repeat protein